MKIGYRESLRVLQQGNSILNNLKMPTPRHTLLPKLPPISIEELKKKRLTRIESFKMFTEKILTKMEETIEVGLLRQLYNKIPDELVKNELLLAYKRRRINIAELRQPYEPFRIVSDAIGRPPLENANVYADDILSITEFDIGKFATFSNKEMEKVFPRGTLGDYQENQHKYTRKFSLMCTEEGFKLTNELRKMNSPRLTEDDYKQIFAEAEKARDVKDILNDEELYPRIFHDIAITMAERLEPYRNDELFNRMFTDCYFFDALVNVLVKELIFPSMRSQLINTNKRAKVIDQIFAQLKEKLDPKFSNPQHVRETFRALKKFEISIPELKNEQGQPTKHDILLELHAQNPRSLPKNMREYGLHNFFGFNSGAMLYGARGAGKSGTLMYSAMWAYKNDWIVVIPPSGYEMTQTNSPLRRHHDSGLYLHLDLTHEFLKSFKTTNEALIKNIPVNLSLYGKYNSAGIHDNEVNPNPVFYIEERKVMSNDWEQFVTEEEKLLEKDEQRELDIRLSQVLPQPKTLLDIVNMGIEKKLLGVNALFELMEQLYNLESHKVLVVVDDYNWFFRPSAYPSFRYANIKGLDATIPAYHMSLCRAFMKFDGHKIKNGFKLTASGHKQLYKHTFTPSHINMPVGYGIKLEGLPLDDFRMACEHFVQSNLWKGGKRGEAFYQQLFCESQGNWHEAIYGIHYPLRAYH